MDSSIIEEDRIISVIANDPVFTEDDIDATTQTLDVNHILESESQLSAQLHDLKNLKVLSSLIKEFNTNLGLLEFENCYYSLQNLRKKINQNNEAFIKQSFHFQKSVVTYVDSLHLELVSTIYDIFSTAFWNITEDKIQFKSSVKWGHDNFVLEHDSVFEVVKQVFFPNDTLDPHVWIIEDMEFGNDRDTVSTKLTDLHKNYVHLKKVTDWIKDRIFEKNALLKYDNKEEDTLQLITFDPKKITVDMKLNCFQDLDNFLLNTMPASLQPSLLDKLGNMISNEFIKCVKSYSGEIIGHNNIELKRLVSDINSQLVALSSKSDGVWTYQPHAIKELLQDRQLYINLLLDQIYNKAVSDIRTTFADKENKWKNTTQVAIKSRTQKKAPIDVEQSEVNDWNWEAEVASEHESGIEEKSLERNEEDEDDIADAWNDEIDLDLDLQSPKKVTKKQSIASLNKQNNKGEEQEEEDGWDEAWDIGEDEDEDEESLEKEALPVAHDNSILYPKTSTANSNDLIEVTQLPTIFLDIIEWFRTEAQNLEDDLTNNPYFNYKISLLQTTFFAMSVTHSSDEWWKFYIDMREIYYRDNSIYRIQELSARYLESNCLLRQKNVWGLMQNQLLEFHEKENAPSWRIVLEELLPFVHKEIIIPISHIKGTESEIELLRFLDFLYNKCITDVILKWEVISEKNSENLGRLISLISDHTEIATLTESSQYRECRAKFEMVGKFLPLHLKEIMDMFYNGDFYLFSTEEIVKWVRLLFAETPIRKGAISDIYEIRQAALEDN
ncbi:hypothetical protein C6P45_004240 [Maudiozyma exigua]|uniref:Retrograde transport protein Dsl1 C-terminal domain-containing protein n=1 Tax=Maudiozyma exigua TaxID=34358 RepID=A0A9P6WCY1_MAUEX|nr:hypothetical protein C6P45_004240 [Kazachstania exigua]